MATRRIVTGTDGEGRSYVVHEGPTPTSIDMGVFSTDEIWVDDPARAPEVSQDPVVQGKPALQPPPGGSRIRVWTFQPGSGEPQQVLQALSKVGDAFELHAELDPQDPAMHRTPTLDYGIVLSGEIDLELDEGEVHLRAGDIVVQRATRHAWRNRGSEPCSIAFILISTPSYR